MAIEYLNAIIFPTKSCEELAHLIVNFRDIESHKINLGESMYPTPPLWVGRGSYSSPNPLER